MRFPRRFLAAACIPTLLAAAAPARAEPPPKAADVGITSTDGEPLEVWDRTDQVTMMPVHTRYGTALTRTHTYKPVCEKTPCTASLEPGSHVLALSKGGGTILDPPEPVVVQPGSKVSATFVDRSGWRAGGFMTLFLTLLASGGVLVAAAAEGRSTTCAGPTAIAPQSCTTTNALDPTLAGVGLGILGAGVIAAAVMLSQHDEASIHVSPVDVAPLVAVREGASRSVAPAGLAVTVRF